ncbi:YicC family protein [Bacteroidales bacterium OttesenSCG-928-M06]|nr:YicC family protein [Bacteroidales bacterium OttesenSCG-928-M06]
MIQSMTGYGKAITELPNKKISIEIKSLNSKQLDINTRVPNIYREKEIEIRNILSQSIERGKVDFSIYIEHLDTQISSRVNSNAIESYHSQIKEIADKLNINEPSDWFSTLLRLPETIKTEIAELDEKEWEIVKATIQKALSGFTEFRMQEGKMLEKIFEEKIKTISTLLAEVEKYDSDRIEKIKQKIQESIKKLELISFDENRFEQEMIYYVERLDVNEEKSRLNNHLNYFIETMKNEKNQGRKLGFITQEIGREINTLGSKSNHAEMQKIVVRMKDELEQIKEQVLNTL